MNIRTFFAILGELLLFIILFILYFTYQLNTTNDKIQQLENEKMQMLFMLDELRQSSDDLSRFAHAYVASSDIKYLNNYYKVLDIRNAKAHRPQNYTSTYWNLQEPLRTQMHPQGTRTSLEAQMKRLPYTKEEFEILKNVEERSNNLTILEMKAFSLLQDEQNQEKATKVLFSQDYLRQKEGIMAPIERLHLSISTRLEESITLHREDFDSIFYTIFIFSVLELALFVLTLILAMKKVLNPIDELTESIAAFQVGSSTPKLIKHYDDEVGGMAKQFFTMQNRLASDYEAMKHLSRTDALTGIGNRRFFFDTVEEVKKVCYRNKENVSLIIMDIDFFKQVNDNYGHIIGDKILKFLVENVSLKLRDSDVFARYGGEEFIVFLPQTDLNGSLTVAQNIREYIQTTEYTDDNYAINITLSIGVASNNQENESLQSLIYRADKALYRAKESGRNKVEVAIKEVSV